MKLQSLKYFCVLAEELHFGRAADRLAMTQPPLSAAIKSLEDELGVVLLLRNSKRVSLTPEGSAFLTEARQILERIDRARSVVSAVHQGAVGRLDIGLSPSLVYRDVLDIVDRFKAEVRGIEIVLHEMTLHDQIERLTHGQLHAGLTNGPAVPPPLQSLRLKDDVFALCLPLDHARARDRVIDLRTMANEDFVTFSREIGPANYDNIITMFTRAGIHPRTVHEVRGWLSTMTLVARGCGVALVPSSLGRAGMAGVCVVPIAGAQTIAPAMLVWNPNLAVPALEPFLATARRVIAQQKKPARSRAKKRA